MAVDDRLYLLAQESQLHKATRIRVSLLAEHDWDLKNNIKSNVVFASFGVCSGCAPLKMLYRMPGFMNELWKIVRVCFPKEKNMRLQYYRFYVESHWLAYKGRRNLFIANYILHDSLTSSNLHFATQDFRWLEFRVLMNKKTAPLEGLRSDISNQFQNRSLIAGNWKQNEMIVFLTFSHQNA